mgnify:CR=1 FL=1
MKLYSENKDYKLYEGSMLDMLEVIEPNSIDSIVTDPPYGLTSIVKRFGKEGSVPASTKNNDGSFARLSKGFMGKEWDGSGIEYNIDTWKKCYEVLKPGGYLLAFGGSRTFHRIACAIEDAGFEIRDTIMWLYGSGFPKSMNIGLAIDKKNGVESKVVAEGKSGVSSRAYQSEETTTAGNYEIKEAQNEWQGWGTSLKPSFEPIIVARKPFKGSLVDNVIEYGVGGINIDECRVGTNEKMKSCKRGSGVFSETANGKITGWNKDDYNGDYQPNEQGRFPANTILTYDETDFDEVCGGFPNTKGGSIKPFLRKNIQYNCYGERNKYSTTIYSGDNGGSASRYFYCAKASKKDRDEGLDTFNEKKVNDGRQTPIDNAFQRGETLRKNTHPTVKPTNLMQYLVRLVTPNNGTVLDPFNGSGSTGKAVMYENKERNKNYKYIGIELTEEYLPIAKARIEYVCNLEPEVSPQMSIFDLENGNE